MAVVSSLFRPSVVILHQVPLQSPFPAFLRCHFLSGTVSLRQPPRCIGEVLNGGWVAAEARLGTACFQKSFPLSEREHVAHSCVTSAYPA